MKQILTYSICLTTISLKSKTLNWQASGFLIIVQNYVCQATVSYHQGAAGAGLLLSNNQTQSQG